MCRTPLTIGAPIPPPSLPLDNQQERITASTNWGSLVIKVGIPLAVAIIAFALLSSKNPTAHNWLFFSFPIMAGLVIGALNIEGVNNFNDRANQWTTEKLAKRKDGEGIRHRFLYSPAFWVLSRIPAVEKNFKNNSIKAGVKVTIFLYVILAVFIAIYIALIIVITAIILALVFFVINLFTDDTPSVTNKDSNYIKNQREKILENKRLYANVAGSKKEVAIIDKDGRVYDTSGWRKKQIATVESDGTIREGDSFYHNIIGKIEEDGTVREGQNFYHETTGKIEEDGTIREGDKFYSKHAKEVKDIIKK
jgi:hypothetical protein